MDEDNLYICIHDYDEHKTRFLECPDGVNDCSTKIEEYMIVKGFNPNHCEWLICSRKDIVIQDLM